MPIKGAVVRRGTWFYYVESELRKMGFKRCGAFGLLVAPGRYFYECSGYLVQIASKSTLVIRRPNGRTITNIVPELEDARIILGGLALDIEFPD